MTENELKIEINLSGLLNELQLHLKKIVFLVSAGINTRGFINQEMLTLPTNNTIDFEGGTDWHINDVQKMYLNWVISNGFRDIIEAVNRFLESTHEVLTIWKLVERQKKGERIRGADWRNLLIEESKKFHRLGFPDKLEHFESAHFFFINHQNREKLLSINSARNCLVHRYGIVGKQDLGLKDFLEVLWLKMKFYFINEKGEKEIVLGESVVGPGEFTSRIVDTIKIFNLGQQVIFSAEEFAEIVVSIIFIGRDVYEKMKEYGTKNGLLSDVKGN